MNNGQLEVHSFFESVTATWSHLIVDKPSKCAALIDPVLNFDARSGKISRHSAEEILAFIKAHHVHLLYVLETHAHADHLSAAPFFKHETGAQIGIGKFITQVQETFKASFGMGDQFAIDGSQFDLLFDDEDELDLGTQRIKVLHVPGHTPADVAYLIGNSIFVGDTLFAPDVGTARCDFPGGSAHELYRSIHRILSLPINTQVYLCHDYPPTSRDPIASVELAQQRKSNIHLHDGISEQDFVAMRLARDKQLEVPILFIPSIQVNINAGYFPEPDEHGKIFLRIPIR